MHSLPRTLFLSRTLLAALVMLAAPLLAGCSSTQPPTLVVDDVRIVERSQTATLLTLTLTATNPNPDPLPLRDVSYQVRVGDAPPFVGTRLAERTIPRFGTQRVTLPVVLPALSPEQLAQGATFTSAGSVIYLRPSVLSQTLLDIEFITPTQDFAGTGRVGE
jgi:hypothetical protein